jgi:hypothetical protein
MKAPAPATPTDGVLGSEIHNFTLVPAGAACIDVGIETLSKELEIEFRAPRFFG